MSKTQECNCLTCGANWSKGDWTEGCGECGGGALQIACFVCGGRCGIMWNRAVMDSNDSAIGHWHGQCNLPEGERKKLMRHR
jgi:hypothetical protein